MAIVRSIPVLDSNGDHFTVYEFGDRRFLRKVRRLKLCTGETIRLDGDTFVVAATGEPLRTI